MKIGTLAFGTPTTNYSSKENKPKTIKVNKYIINNNISFAILEKN